MRRDSIVVGNEQLVGVYLQPIGACLQLVGAHSQLVGLCLQPVDVFFYREVYFGAELEQCRRALQAAVPFPMLCPAAYSANI